MAYEIIKRLGDMNESAVLQQLAANVETSRKANKKMDEVWELSFEACPDFSGGRIAAAMNLCGKNQTICITTHVRGKWRLAANPVEYVHSSAAFYLAGVQGFYAVTNFMEMEDVDF